MGDIGMFMLRVSRYPETRKGSVSRRSQGRTLALGLLNKIVVLSSNRLGENPKSAFSRAPRDYTSRSKRGASSRISASDIRYCRCRNGVWSHWFEGAVGAAGGGRPRVRVIPSRRLGEVMRDSGGKERIAVAESRNPHSHSRGSIRGARGRDGVGFLRQSQPGSSGYRKDEPAIAQ